MKKLKSWTLGLLKTENRALIAGAGLLIVGAFLGVSGIVDLDLAMIIAGSVLTTISVYVTVSAFIDYQWHNLIEEVRMAHYMGKVATEDYLAEIERRKHDGHR